MKNNWKYSTLSEAEKLERIQGGDTELYKAEMDNAKNYAALLADAGVDTGKADSYINKLSNAAQAAQDNASATASDGESTSVSTKSSGSSKTANTEAGVKNKSPYASGSRGKFLQSVYDNLLKEGAEYVKNKKALTENRKNDMGYMSEWLVNNGYSLDGAFGSEKLGKIKSTYDKAEKALDEEFERIKTNAEKILGNTHKF